MDYIIGVDIGTSSSKALAWSVTGKVLAEAQQGYATAHPQTGYSEQDPDEVLAAVVSVIAGVRKQVDRQPVCVSFSAAMHSLMAVDEKGDPLTPLLLWSDARSQPYAATLQKSRKGKTIFRHTGTPVHAMSPLCKLIWWRQEQPEIFARAGRFISIKEYVFYRLLGRYVVDYGIASATGLFDNEKLRWYPPALKTAGITSAQLSEPVSGLHIIKGLQEKYVRALELDRATSFVAGGSDGCLANLGSEAIRPGSLAITIGTSGAVRMISKKPVSDPRQSLFCYLLKEDEYVVGGAINNGGVLLEWFTREFGHDRSDEEEYREFIKTAMSAPVGSDALFFLPYILGERSPMWDARARGAFIGIDVRHTRAHFMRAVLEGICYSLYGISRTVAEQVAPVKQIFASGGFTHSPEWVQLLADMVGKPVHVSGNADASSIGAVMMGGVAAGVWKNWKEAAELLTVTETYKPVAANHKRYRQHYELFASLYEPLKEKFHQITALQAAEGVKETGGFVKKIPIAPVQTTGKRPV